MTGYIVTTKRPSTGWGDSGLRVSSCTVDTLDEAREIVDKATGLGRRGGFEYFEHISESGGTVGPLPDGTVIEVTVP